MIEVMARTTDLIVIVSVNVTSTSDHPRRLEMKGGLLKNVLDVTRFYEVHGFTSSQTQAKPGPGWWLAGQTNLAKAG